MKPFLLLGCLFLCACPFRDVSEREVVRQAVYGEIDSAKAGRYDLVDQYNDDLVRLVPPPKKRLPVKPVQ